MTFQIEVNGKEIGAKKGETILETLIKNGIKVPTLCQVKDLTPSGACRLCVVEVEGIDKLVPACSFNVQDFMRIKTHSPRVIKARKTIVELLLANHPDDCLFCERNLNCELQMLADELNIRERKKVFTKQYAKLDKSSSAIVHDSSKCIMCGRCIRICDEQQHVSTYDFIGRGKDIHVGLSFDSELGFSSCISCGMCILACPTGALHEKINIDEVQEAIFHKNITTAVQYAPSVTVSIAEEFGLKPGKDLEGIMNTILRNIGFDYVFDSSFASDIMILEESKELVNRLENKDKLPMFDSSCPAWVKYAEQFHQELLPKFSTVKSSQQILGALLKTHFSGLKNINSESLFTVSIMPCTSRKFEAQRVEMGRKAILDVDAVITTRELARLIRLFGIDINNLDIGYPDVPYAQRSSSGKIIGASGGISEAVMRTSNFLLDKKELDVLAVKKLRGGEGLRIHQTKLGPYNFNVMVVSGLAYIDKAIKELKDPNNDIHFVEVMACPGGCVNGGGQPLNNKYEGARLRSKALYDIDSKETIRVAHKNTYVKKLYEDFLGEPCNKLCKDLLHTSFTERTIK